MTTLVLLALLLQGLLVPSGAQPCSPDSGATRLLNFTSNLYAGFAEVCLNGTWGTVCADSPTTLWSEKNAHVFCRDLGYSGALNAVDQSTLPLPYLVNNGSGINYRDVFCNGTETSLSQCPHSINTTGCDHSFDAVVVCRQSEINGDIQLVGSTTNGQGAVEIYDQKTSQWYHVCPDDSFKFVAPVMCRQLGYDSGSYYILSLNGSSLKQGSVTTCTDLRCYVTPNATCSAPSWDGAAVNCSSSGQSSLSVRLDGANVYGEGRVEVFYNGMWGTVCNNNKWTSADAQAMCSQVAKGMLSSAVIGSAEMLTDLASVKPIWLSGVVPGNTFYNFTPPIGYGVSCDHSKDLVLFCFGVPTVEASGGFPLPVLGVLGVIPVLLTIVLACCVWRRKKRRILTQDKEDTFLYTKNDSKYQSI